MKKEENRRGKPKKGRKEEGEKSTGLTQKLAQIMPIILRRVLLRMVARRQDSHLVTIDSVVIEEMARLLVDLARTVLLTPQMQQLLIHGPRAKFGYLAQI